MDFLGFKIVTDPRMVKRVFSRVQTRKLKNNRWRKKYRKKYSEMVPETEAIIHFYDRLMVCHPSVRDSLLERIKRDNLYPAPRFSMGMVGTARGWRGI